MFVMLGLVLVIKFLIFGVYNLVKRYENKNKINKLF